MVLPLDELLVTLVDGERVLGTGTGANCGDRGTVAAAVETVAGAVGRVATAALADDTAAAAAAGGTAGDSDKGGGDSDADGRVGTGLLDGNATDTLDALSDDDGATVDEVVDDDADNAADGRTFKLANRARAAAATAPDDDDDDDDVEDDEDVVGGRVSVGGAPSISRRMIGSAQLVHRSNPHGSQ